MAGGGNFEAVMLVCGGRYAGKLKNFVILVHLLHEFDYLISG